MKPNVISKALAWTAVLFFLATMSALSQTKSTKVLSDSKLGAANLKGTSETAAPTVNAPGDYRIGVNDVVDISVWKEPELSRTVPVRPDGKISLPLIGELVAEGKTAVELDDLITNKLKEFLARPGVTVIVQQINSQRYFVMGEVEHPGSFPLSSATNVIQALAAAGSFKEWAHTNDITIIRRMGNNQTDRIHFNYNAWNKKKAQVDPPELKNGDVVMVP